MRRRGFLSLGLALGLAACASEPARTARPPRARATPGMVDEPALVGLNAVIDLHHANGVKSFAMARDSSGVLAVIHKASEGDWQDPRYEERRAQAMDAGLLWGAYHFGTRQHPGRSQAQMFLAAARPDPATLLVLDLELNERAPGNTMQIDAAEDFVREIAATTGRLPLLYCHPAWADGETLPSSKGSGSLGGAILPGSALAACDLWLADYRYEPELPNAWNGRGWRMWQYAGDDARTGGPFRDRAREVRGIERCDRSVFAGSRDDLYRYWGGIGRSGA
ncbi:Lyzozyme M1 (1 4-beta-N-acetylmuramidase) [Paramagnetospirillum magnetotacticum MS-1]|uniref:Lyzozyme M1 (1 4-beta-N-acetylmuramidase) n=1 Tax=Paramagnetospirillum magnetotacticum MS-1 TaxID=272627 RepID=A0A0C2V2T8_PARME|nr:glycoside hydrolase family 25 protein [Paramagnetospirillum magnetotacticum]KIL99401.1 Lyzozyme M1 (1 4-beta-N-acetylmuramidase) [Paramagnetospirillum magnetotacticum MS-1]